MNGVGGGESSAGSNASSTMPSPALNTHYQQSTNNASSSNISMMSSNESTNGSVGRPSGVMRMTNMIKYMFNGDNGTSQASVVSTPRQLTRQPPSGLNLDAQTHANHLGLEK